MLALFSRPRADYSLRSAADHGADALRYVVHAVALERDEFATHFFSLSVTAITLTYFPQPYTAHTEVASVYGEMKMLTDIIRSRSGRGLVLATAIVSAAALTMTPNTAKAGIGTGGAIALGLGAFALGSALTAAPYYAYYGYPYGYYPPAYTYSPTPYPAQYAYPYSYSYPYYRPNYYAPY
jgi:hypothetical protein